MSHDVEQCHILPIGVNHKFLKVGTIRIRNTVKCTTIEPDFVLGFFLFF